MSKEKNNVENVIESAMRNLDLSVEKQKTVGEVIVNERGQRVIPVFNMTVGVMCGGGEYGSLKISKDFFEILEPNKGMKELVQNLCDKGHRVKIVSYSYEESKQYKIKYIKKHFPKVEYEILTHDKSLVLDKRDAIDKKVDLCIDDSLEALKLSDAKIKILYGCTKYNRENDSYIRVVNAKELKEVIDNFNILKNLGVKF